MSVYTSGHINSRTAGYIPGVTPAQTPHGYRNSNGHGLSPSPQAGVHPPEGTALPPKTVSKFDALLQNGDLASSPPNMADTPPSAELTGINPSAAGRHINSFEQHIDDNYKAALMTPGQPGDVQKPTMDQHLNSRTAGREVSATKSMNFNTDKTDGEFSFWDFIDIINPLQHIPLVSTAYRAITGDEIKAPARILGGAVFGGPIGAAFGVANAMTESATGGDIGETVTAFVSARKGGVVHNATDNTAFDQIGLKAAAFTKEDITWTHSIDKNKVTHQNLSKAHPTHNYPTHQGLGKSALSAPHSLHLGTESQSAGARPETSNALKKEERTREEILLAGRQNAGSPMSPNLHEVQVKAAESASSSEPIAPQDISMKMMDALDKYQAMKR